MIGAPGSLLVYSCQQLLMHDAKLLNFTWFSALLPGGHARRHCNQHLAETSMKACSVSIAAFHRHVTNLWPWDEFIYKQLHEGMGSFVCYCGCACLLFRWVQHPFQCYMHVPGPDLASMSKSEWIYRPRYSYPFCAGFTSSRMSCSNVSKLHNH